MKLIFEFARIAAFCFAGEVCHLVLPLPIPASVYGLMLLLAALRFGVVKLEQVRTAALAMKLADREIHKNAIGEYPVMLLDDVLSELDASRQAYLLGRLHGRQIFLTGCELPRNLPDGGALFFMERGRLSRGDGAAAQ